ncbi:MAG TPA: erythromycin esterase family protein [Opitutaceae bacterium]
MTRYHDRTAAGRALAGELTAYRLQRDVLILALPRGGVPVAAEVARALRAPLDVFLVRKLGVPDHPELALGAIATGGVRVLNDDIVRDLRLRPEQIERVTREESRELHRREQRYRGDRPAPEVAGHTLILVDDGLATGATMRAAIAALRRQSPQRIVVAVPVGAAEICLALREEADDLVCPFTPDPFLAVGAWYDNFGPPGDAEVAATLAAHADADLRPPDSGRAADGPAAVIRSAAYPYNGDTRDLERICAWVGDARLVLIGEATHGTREFYEQRAAITRHLISEHGFSAVAVEADWPDAYRVNRFVQGRDGDANATAALGDFQRFPLWMWRNTTVRVFVHWLHEYNAALPMSARAGFYGLDLYSLHASMRAVVAYLEKLDPRAAATARANYACFDHLGADPDSYAWATTGPHGRSCEDEVVAQLVQLRQQQAEYLSRDGLLAQDEYFHAEQNARLARNAERYYRTLFSGRVASWNVRDTHMAETLEELARHLEGQGRAPKIVVWAHNSHLGDARATDLGDQGELNLGQLVRQVHGDDARLLGLTTYAGTVTAASDWGGAHLRKQVRPALEGSYEALFHETGVPRFFLPLLDIRGETLAALAPRRLERAIGVIYRPETERLSHYFEACLPNQFDAVLHLDRTHAIVPLDVNEGSAVEAETFPTGV